MRPSTIFLIPVLCFFLNLSAFAQTDKENLGSDKIRINQVGYYPEGQKIAIIVTSEATEFSIHTLDGRNEIFSGKLSDAKEWPHSKETVKQANFSSVENSGKYVLHVPGIGTSYPFEINENVHFKPAKASMKAFYFQRASADLSEEYAGKWAREAGHPDDQVKVHNSAVSESRPAGSTISSPGGWYDAGDYGKYIVNSGITMGTLFSLYEDFPEYLDTLNLNIPESQTTSQIFLMKRSTT